jgi:hypothetical protein
MDDLCGEFLQYLSIKDALILGQSNHYFNNRVMRVMRKRLKRNKNDTESVFYHIQKYLDKHAADNRHNYPTTIVVRNHC